MKKYNLQKNIIFAIVFILLAETFFLLLFKKIRLILPPPLINDDKLVGFAQYNGYPVYYDTFYFLFLLLLPLVVILFVYNKLKKQ